MLFYFFLLIFKEKAKSICQLADVETKSRGRMLKHGGAVPQTHGNPAGMQQWNPELDLYFPLQESDTSTHYFFAPLHHGNDRGKNRTPPTPGVFFLKRIRKS